MVAATAAVSARKIFFASEIEMVFLWSAINSLSFSEKSPSGPIKIQTGFFFDKIFFRLLESQLISQKTIFPFSSIGTPPQDLKYKGEKNSLIIGNNNKFREYVNINPGTAQGGGVTKIGNDNQIYPFAAIGNDPQDLKYNGEQTKLVIGNNNKIREYVTIHPGT